MATRHRRTPLLPGGMPPAPADLGRKFVVSIGAVIDGQIRKLNYSKNIFIRLTYNVFSISDITD